MAEAARTLSLLRQEVLITDEVLGALSRCQRQVVEYIICKNSVRLPFSYKLLLFLYSFITCGGRWDDPY